MNVTENSVNDEPLEKCRNEGENDFDIANLERDPEKQCLICKYPMNERDHIRRNYVVLRPCQPILSSYRCTFHGSQGWRFNLKWFKEWSWLEYSVESDKAYCFPCFLFDSYPSQHPAFTEHGFNGWKNVMTKNSGILHHVGSINSQHSANIHNWESLSNPAKHIDHVINTISSQEVADNRLRFIVAIESVRLLAHQGITFRVMHDESTSSSNAGNFNAVVDSFIRMSIEVRRVVENAPGNAKYTSSTIQKQIANILANKVRTKIRDEVGDANFCILVDEAVNASHEEQMPIIIRFVDCEGFTRERFFKVLHVTNTCSQTLKDGISRVLVQYDLQVENMRGQGYDGASNMRVEFHGLQALFR